LAIQTALAPALIQIAGWAAPEVEQAFTRAHELCRKLGDPPEAFGVLYGMATMHEYRGEYQHSQMLMEERLLRQHHPENPKRLVQAHELLACSLFHQGALADALEHADRALIHYDPARHRSDASPYAEDLGVGCHVWAAQTLWLLGYPDQAVRRTQSAIELSEQLGHRFSLTTALGQLACIFQYRRQAVQARAWAEASLALATEQGFRYREGIAEMLYGWSLAVVGQSTEGITRIRRGLDIYRATGTSMETPYFLALLAEALIASRQFDNARRSLDEALGLVRESRSFFYEAELLRLKGSVLLVDGGVINASDAEVCFIQSLDIAGRQRARSLELRTAISMGRSWMAQGRRDEAQQLLKPIYETFTEGVDTPDLIEASTMIGQSAGSGADDSRWHAIGL
jgi:predicted ATPase